MMASLPPLATPWVFDANRDPPVYTRPLVGSELVMQRLRQSFDGACEICFGINFTSPLRVNELQDRAREALDKLRFVCPIIACTIEDDVSPRWVYTPSGDRQAWLNLAFIVEERGSSLSSSEFVQSTSLKRLPYTDEDGTTTFLGFYLLTTSAQSNEGNKEYGLYFHGSHSIIDAGPALHALNLVCEWISGEGMDVRINASEEWKNLPVDPITATGGLVGSGDWETAGIRLLQEFAEQDARTVPRLNVARPTRSLNMSHPPFRYTITASESETTAIIAETRKLGVSVSALFHAAFCLAQIKMNPVSEGTEVDFSSDSTIISLERYMKPPVDPRTHLISSHTMMPLRFSMSQVLMEHSERARLIMTARILQDRFDKYLADPCLPHLFAVIAASMAADASQLEGRVCRTESTGKEKAEEVSTSWWSTFNNLGVVEKRLKTQHGKINVQSICRGTRLRLYMTLHMWTIHSKLHFQVQGDTAWEEDYTKLLAEETRRIGLLVLRDIANLGS